MSIDGQGELTTDGAWAAEGLEGALDLAARLWRVATWEYDATTDVVYWFDDPGETLHLAEGQAAALLDPVVVAVRHGAPWEHYDLDHTLDDLDGVAIDLRVQARLLRGADGAVSGCVGVITDVSEQRRNEQALRGAIARYRRLVELSPDTVLVHQDGLIRYMSPAGLRRAGVDSVAELIGRPILDFIHPSSLDETLERIALLTEPGMVSEPAEAVLLSPDGKPTVMESISIRIEWDGRPAYQVILRDVSERRRAEAALRYQASLVTHVSDAVVATDAEGLIRSWNPAAEELYGRRADEVVQRPVAEILGEGAVGPDGTPRSGEVEHQRASGEPLTVRVSVAPVRDEFGEHTGTVAVCTDLTEGLERRAAEARYRAVVAALDEGVLVVDRDGTIVSVNASARAMLGDWLAEGMHSTAVFEHWDVLTEGGARLPAADTPLTVGLRTGRAQSSVVIGIADADGVRWLSVSVQPLEHQRAGAVVCSFSDITDRKRIEAELGFQATHDPLTRLPNRDRVLETLGEAITRARDTRAGGVGLLLLDLDRFKTVNDTFGHAVGDRVLQVVASRIAGAIRAGDHLARLAGDEFVVVCPQLESNEGATGLAARIAEAVSAPLRLPSGRELVVTTSIGIAWVDAGEGSPEVALSHADVAMYRAKELGRARAEVFDDELRAAVSRRLLIHEGLRGAVDAQEITAEYQPITCAATDRVVGVEVLARWEHRTLGQIGPAEFIPIAEETGLMVALGSRILQTACSEVARWQRERRCPPDLTLNVNLSPRQLADPDFASNVAGILDATGFEADRLWLEVTESVLMEEAAYVSQALAELRALGVHFAIDDFGTGYSSLVYLKRFPVDALKIDRSFVEGLSSDPESDAIVAAIIGLAQSLHLTTIAEGVETPEQVARLRELGCDLLQGYLVGRPISGHHVRFPSDD